MMQKQQLQTPVTTAPGQPIGYAPIYGATPPPLATDAPTTPPQTKTSDRFLNGLIIGGLIGSSIFALSTWGLLDNLYAGADIRGLQRQADAANTTAEQAEQRAANAESNAQQWQQHAAAQGQTIDGVKELVCR